MKIVLAIVAVVICLVMVAPASARDYSKMSNDELYQVQKQGIPVQDRGAFQDVWVRRVAVMSPEELEKYQVAYSYDEIQRMRCGYSNPEYSGVPLPPSG